MDRITPQHAQRGLAALLLFALAACAKQEPPLPQFGIVPEFELTSEQGQPFGSHQLIGHPWVAAFIYTTCPGPCPRMSKLMLNLQSETTKVNFVSFTIDPARDTPPVLAEYAKRYKADPKRWTFLTGPVTTLHKLNREAFKLGDVNGSFDHSTRLVLVDQFLNVRGYYGTADEEGIMQLKTDLIKLEKEKR